MQNRIEELARKARALATTKDAFEEYDVYFDAEKFEQVFAELLIKECVSSIDKVEELFFNARIDTHDFTEKQRYAEAETACKMAKHKIEQYFGIKE